MIIALSWHILQEDCEGHFSTSPELVKLYLPEILEHFGSCFPLDAVPYVNPDNKDSHPFSEVVNLTQMTVEISIIASTCCEQDSKENEVLVSLPVNLDIKVTFLGRESNDKDLYQSTKTLFNKLSNLKTADVGNNTAVENGATLVCENYLSSGAEIKMPYRLSGVFDGEDTSQQYEKVAKGEIEKGN